MIKTVLLRAWRVRVRKEEFSLLTYSAKIAAEYLSAASAATEMVENELLDVCDYRGEVAAVLIMCKSSISISLKNRYKSVGKSLG